MASYHLRLAQVSDGQLRPAVSYNCYNVTVKGKYVLTCSTKVTNQK